MARAFERSELMFWRVCQGRYGPLLVALLTLCVLAPSLTGDATKGALLDAAMSCIVLTGLYAAVPGRRALVIAFALGCVTLATHRLVTVYHFEPLHVAHYAMTFLILAYTARTILWAVLRDTRVTIETIKGAVCVYLLAGLMWVYAFVMIDITYPGSFRLELTPEGQAVGHLIVRRDLHRLLYLSFCTLTTVGYGDIVPLRGAAQTACYLEAIAGQIYLTVLVARLVGMHISGGPSPEIEPATTAGRPGAEDG